MTNLPSNNERLRDELQKEHGRLSGQKTFAWVVIVISALLFLSNFLAFNEPTNNTLGALTLMGLIGGGVWLYDIRTKLTRNVRRSLENRP